MKIHLAYVLFQGASLYILDFYAFYIYFHKTISMNKFFLRGSIIFSGLLQLLLHIWDVFTLGTVEFCSRMRKVLFYWHGSFITCLFSFLCFFVIYVSVMIVNSLTVSRLVVLQEPFQFFFQLLTTLFNIYSMYACFLFKKVYIVCISEGSTNYHKFINEGLTNSFSYYFHSFTSVAFLFYI